MNTSEIQLSVNDYLDLYLYAERINDSLWKMELIEKLQNLHNEKRGETLSFVPKYLLEQYKNVNEEIRTIYRQLRTDSANTCLLEKIQELKQLRISLSCQIQDHL